MDPVDELIEMAERGVSLFAERNALQHSHIPNTIQHRDAEQTQVTQSLLPIIRGSRPSNLLVYGKPGTGKTLVVRKVILKIQESVKKRDFPIRLVYANAKVETTLYGLLVSFGRQLDMGEKELPWTGISISSLFTRILDKIQRDSINVVLVIDEIDFLARMVSKSSKDILYHITRANERLQTGSLTFVGISNDLTFKDVLDPRVFSSLGEEEIVFSNYTIDQLHSILVERIKIAFKPGVVEESASNLCATMAGREHGDARRAIDLIRVAGEIAERDQSKHVIGDHIHTAFEKIEEDKETTAIKSYPLHEKMVLAAVMRANDLTTGSIYNAYKELCRSVRQKELTQRRITQILSEIEMSGLISGRVVHQGVHGNTKKFKLMISPDLVRDTLRQDVTFEEIV